MKMFPIIIIITLEYIFCITTNVYDINLSKILNIDINEYSEGYIPKESKLYFRLKIEDKKTKYIHLLLPKEIENKFNIKYYDFIEKPSEEEITNEELKYKNLQFLEKHLYDKYNDFIYSTEIDNEISYISISFIPNFDLYNISIYVSNYEEDYNWNKYDIKYLTYYEIDIQKVEKNNTLFELNSTEEHTGEIIMNLIVPQDADIKFYIYGVGLQTGKIEELIGIDDTEGVLINFFLNKIIKEDINDIYEYSFILDEETKYFFIYIEINKIIDYLKVYFYEKNKDIQISDVYNVTYSTEYQIEKKNLVKSDNPAFTLKSINPHYGDTFIHLKVNKDISKDYFNLIGYGYNDYLSNENKINPISLNIKYNDTLEENEYNIHKYYFKLNENSLYFAINVFLNYDLNYLSIYLPGSNFQVYDISFFTEYIIEGKIPLNKKLYFRIQNDDGQKFVQLRTLLNIEAQFEVSLCSFKSYPSDEQIYNEKSEYYKVELNQKNSDFNNDIYIYNPKIDENIKYFSILVNIKKELNYISIYVKKENKEKAICYGVEFLISYKINFEQINQNYPLLSLRSIEEHSGENCISIEVSHNENSTFDINGNESKTFEIEKKESNDNLNILNINLDAKINGPENDIYRYCFILEEDYRYFAIDIQLIKKVEYFSFYFFDPNKEEETKKKYNVTNSTEYQIDNKYLVASNDYAFTLISITPNIGDNYIKLKVKKGVTKDYFYLGGYGSTVYPSSSLENKVHRIALGIKFNETLSEDQHDILKYYFKSYDNSTYFHINVFIYKPIDYLSVQLEQISKKSDDNSENSKNSEGSDNSSISPIILSIIIIVSCLIALFILYFVLRKYVFSRNDITYKEIEKVNQDSII